MSGGYLALSVSDLAIISPDTFSCWNFQSGLTICLLLHVYIYICTVCVCVHACVDVCRGTVDNFTVQLHVGLGGILVCYSNLLMID